MGLAHSPTITTNGIVFCMDLASARSYSGSGTSVNDSSGSVGVGTLTNGPTFTNNYVTLDGTDDSIIFPSSSRLAFGTGNYTIQVLFTLSADKGNQYLFDFGSNQFALQYISGTTFRFLTNNTNIKDVAYPLTLNTLYEVTITRVGTTGYLYINGEQVGTWSDSDTYSVNTLQIGKYGGNNSYNWQGRIYYFKAYNVALSQPEILKNYNTIQRRFKSYPSLPITYYPPDIIRSGLAVYLNGKNPSSYSGSGSTWTDLSGNGVNATIVGSPTFTDGFRITSDSTYITFPNATINPRTNDFTYYTWIYYNSASAQYNTVFENGSWGDTLLWRYENSGNFTIYAESAFRGQFAWTATLNTWVNIVMKRESGVATAYINGSQIGSTVDLNIDINLANPTMYLMRSQHASSQYTNGKMSAFAVYNRALSTSEIATNYERTRGFYGI